MKAKDESVDTRTPENIHYAIVGAFEVIIEVGIFNGESGKAGQYGKKLNIIFVKNALCTGVDAHYADGLTVYLKWDA